MAGGDDPSPRQYTEIVRERLTERGWSLDRTHVTDDVYLLGGTATDGTESCVAIVAAGNDEELAETHLEYLDRAVDRYDADIGFAHARAGAPEPMANRCEAAGFELLAGPDESGGVKSVGDSDGRSIPSRRSVLAAGLVGVAGLGGLALLGGDSESETPASGDSTPPDNGPAGAPETATPDDAPRSGGALSVAQRTKLVADNGDKGDAFGDSVATDGDTVLVGAPGDEGGNSVTTGSAYVFERADGGWDGTKLTAPDGERGDWFGRSVAVGDGVALVEAGGVHVFARDEDGWSHETVLRGPDGGPMGGSSGDTDSLALDGSTALVGAPPTDPNDPAPGSALVFERRADRWEQVTELTAKDGDGEDYFGDNVALDGELAVVGAANDADPNGQGAGSAYVFERVDGEWHQQAKLTAEDGDERDSFGGAVAVDGTTILVGADWDDDPNGQGAGSAYIFERVDGEWHHQVKIAPESLPAEAWFGSSVALSGDIAVVGANNDYTKSDDVAGSVYAFTSPDESWSSSVELSPGDSSMRALFGYSVALSGTTVVAGVPGDNKPNGRAAGSAYVFDISA